jgi:mRNA-degrading endonuclease YafQ of YafQ-DinJ toxin-antitoxin module
VRAFRLMARRDAHLRDRMEKTLKRLTQNPMDPILRVHKLKGELAGAWACSVDYDIRIIFEFIENPDTREKEILLLAFGTHDEVY